MSFSRSLRFKITAWYLLTTGSMIGAIAGVVIVGLTRNAINNADLSLLSTEHVLIQQLEAVKQANASDSDNNAAYAFRLGAVERGGLDSSEGQPLIRLYDTAHGTSIYESRVLKHSFLTDEFGSIPLPSGTRAEVAFAGVPHESRMRVAMCRVPGTTLLLQLALLWDRREEDAEETGLRLGTLVAGFLLLSGLTVMTLVKRALEPVSQIVKRAAALTLSGYSGEIVPPSNVSDLEIQSLVAAVNGMVSRLHNTYERQRDFTADAAHELRTPLTIMQGEMELALMKERSVDKYVQVISSALDETRRLAKIVESLGEIARADIDSLEQPARVNFDLEGMVESIVEQLQPVALEKQICVSLVSKCGAAIVRGNEDAIARAVSNLIRNALNYTPPGGQIEIVLNFTNNHAVITITDTGAGIAQEDLPRIFDRFYRADKSRLNSGGHGLGLAIVKAVVEAHGGNVQVYSQQGEGCTFTIEIPVG